MGIEGKERTRDLETGAQALSGQLGKTVQRLRKAYNLSLSELAEQSGVAKSIISQIERNETNPTLATIWRLITGWIKTVEWLQWYDFHADPGGVLASDPHQRGSVECLSVLEGELEVEVAGAIEIARAGETLRYRCDRAHTIRNCGKTQAQATMICMLKAAVME